MQWDMDYPLMNDILCKDFFDFGRLNRYIYVYIKN